MPKTTTTKSTMTKENASDEVIELLKKQLEAMNKELEALKKGTQEAPVVAAPVSVSKEPETYDEPNPNKQVRVMSLCYGMLNLSTEPKGRGKLITFNKYGETKMVLYSTLIDIVNNNRGFAEKGYFYILDKSVVYYLGLSAEYEKLMPREVMDKIYNYSEVEIESILNNTTKEQRDVLVHNTADMLYHNQTIDLNKCKVIEKCCGVNFANMVNEMHSFDKVEK